MKNKYIVSYEVQNSDPRVLLLENKSSHNIQKPPRTIFLHLSEEELDEDYIKCEIYVKTGESVASILSMNKL